MTRQPDKVGARMHLVIRGRVQGIGFRFATLDEAHSLALSGWVRNRADGSVEIVAEGVQARLRMLLAWAHCGPPMARIDELETEWLEATGEFADFKIA